jgi:hypothetical protein
VCGAKANDLELYRPTPTKYPAWGEVLEGAMVVSGLDATNYLKHMWMIDHRPQSANGYDILHLIIWKAFLINWKRM